VGKILVAFSFFLAASAFAVHEAQPPPRPSLPTRAAAPPARAAPPAETPPWVKYATRPSATRSRATHSPPRATPPPPPPDEETADEGEATKPEVARDSDSGGDVVDARDACGDGTAAGDDGCPEVAPEAEPSPEPVRLREITLIY
jgi:hypothetical protein